MICKLRYLHIYTQCHDLVNVLTFFIKVNTKMHYLVLFSYPLVIGTHNDIINFTVVIFLPHSVVFS